jgi:hypothetical protein
LGKTSFERRTPTSAELRAAQTARAGGASPEKALQAAQKTNLPTTGPTPAIPSASSVAADVAKANSPAVINRPAPAGSALAAQQAQQKLKPPTPGTGIMQKQSYEWPSEKEIGNIASAYASIYEAKKKVDQDEDGDNDFADVRIARMIASGVPKAKAIAMVKNKSYNKEEYSLDEETKAEKEARIAARRARVKEMEKEGAVMTSSRRTSEVARQRKEAKKAEALERAASAILNQMHGATGRVSEKPMGSQAPKAKEKAPEATRRLNPNLRKDNLGSAADRVLKSMKKEELELWVNELIEEGYDLSEYTWDEMAEIYLDEATAMSKRGYDETEIRNRIAKSTGGGEAARGTQRSALTPKEKKQLNREAYEAYELVASYLLENNFATTVEDANQIINNMSENWFDSIIEEKKPLPVAKMKRKEEKLDKELGSEMSKVLRTEIDSPERKELLRKNRRFGDMHDVRRSVSTRGGKRPLPMPEVGRYKPKDED